MFKKIIWALLEVSTIGFGTYVFISTMVDSDYVDKERAGIGAFLIVTGLLLRNWRTTLFIKTNKDEQRPATKSELPKTNLLLIVILSLLVFSLHKKVNDVKLDLENNESGIGELEFKMEIFEGRLENAEALEDRIDELESYAHSHY